MRRLLITCLALSALAACSPEDGATAPEQTPASDPTSSAADGAPAPANVEPSPTYPEGPELDAPEGWQKVDGQRQPVEDGWGQPVDAAELASGVLAVGCTDTVPAFDEVAPTAATEGLLDRDDAPGVALSFTFDSAEDASGFFDLWHEQMAACEQAGDLVTSVVDEEGHWAGHRSIQGPTWTESVVLSGEELSLIALEADLSDEETLALAELQR